MRDALSREPGPGFDEYRILLATALKDQGKKEESLQVLDKDAPIVPSSPRWCLLRGRLHLELEKRAEAKRDFENAIALRPTYAEAYEGLATVCDALGDKVQAQRCRKRYEILKAKRPDVPVARNIDANEELPFRRRVAEIDALAGKSLMAGGDGAQAEACFRAAAAFDPYNRDCRYSLAALCGQQGRLEDALEAVRQLRELAPDDALVFYNLGELQKRLGDFDAAEEAMSNACRLAPRQALGYVGLAALYLQSNRKLADARRIAATAVRLEPNNKQYRELQQELESRK
jgi:Flp pilus assembly protein TadD